MLVNEKHEQFAVIILHVDLLPETFCRGDVLLRDVLLGDVLSSRRFVRRRFVCASSEESL
jgi:hypothetical protein